MHRFRETFRSEEYNKLFAAKPPKDSAVVDIRIETEGIDERWEQLDVKGNEQSAPHVFPQKGKTLVLFNNSPTPAGARADEG
ncbi:MAG: hypothetical protein MZV63_43050 [Marinilabiliales bacterium]|nr:hypothetical protein [Marinilabiliales bacterium]